MQMKRLKKYAIIAFILILIIAVCVIAARTLGKRNSHEPKAVAVGETRILSELQYDGDIAIEIGNNSPTFTDRDLKKAKTGFESYSELDSLGRCGVADASICVDTMPAEGEKRGNLGSVNPSGWQSGCGWCRCHLIGWQLSAENDNERNLITGTTRMNMSGMLPYENIVAKYIEENPGGHVLYRVEPVYDGNNLVACGVKMEAESVEDKGESVSFNVYIFNYQPGKIINYKDGTVENDPNHQTVITITDKNARYTGEPVAIEAATVEGSTGDVRYLYYTDTDAKIKTTEADGSESNGSAPSRRGTYYVRAVVSGDDWYPTATSNVAVLKIY